MKGNLILEDGTIFQGESFGAEKSITGETVFSTGMLGYPEAITDPSYIGQILIATYPIMGSYGVANSKNWESDGIKISALIVSQYIDTPSHFQSEMSLGEWLKKEGVPGLIITDTRLLAQKLRDKGTLLGKIEFTKKIDFYNPDSDNLVAQVSTKKIVEIAGKDGKWKNKTIMMIDCGAKRNIIKCLNKRGVKLIIVPWNYNPFTEKTPINFDAILISNGPGNPKMADKTIITIKEILKRKIPILGICLGNQLLALAAGGETKKLKFGHRSQNQPCILVGGKRCYITTQNHGFYVSKIPDGFKNWFINANDGTSEGLMHKKYPFMSVQFHPEAMPGPEDTEWIFDFFLERAFIN
ncbi:carbamoyl-phosphate synthase small chain [Candidatus Levyibacteriota bacterium]|nr:carbamoyl-phosphate synthase (glutamine-hydrolyzing) small subunit [Candidatus Levybacteria bacterium]GDX62108.1 carbamoyl-phosphate synthase small chain [Candidatus Levybacteria bacterium]